MLWPQKNHIGKGFFLLNICPGSEFLRLIVQPHNSHLLICWRWTNRFSGYKFQRTSDWNATLIWAGDPFFYHNYPHSPKIVASWHTLIISVPPSLSKWWAGNHSFFFFFVIWVHLLKFLLDLARNSPLPENLPWFLVCSSLIFSLLYNLHVLTCLHWRVVFNVLYSFQIYKFVYTGRQCVHWYVSKLLYNLSLPQPL